MLHDRTQALDKNSHRDTETQRFSVSLCPLWLILSVLSASSVSITRTRFPGWGSMTNRQITLKKRPAGLPTQNNFDMPTSPVPVPQKGQVLRGTLFLTLDPYMRGRMSNASSYAPP